MKFDLKKTSGFFLMPCKTLSILQSADDISLKVLICLYSSAGYNLDEKELCDSLLISKEELRKAISFLSAKGLLKNDAGVISLYYNDAKQLLFSDKAPDYSFAEIEKAINNNGSMKNVLNETQALLGKVLSPAETKLIYSLYDWLSLPPDVILMIVNYCISEGKNNLRYIEKIAVDWADRDINTHERVAIFLEEVRKRKTIEGQIRKLTGIGERALSKMEKEYISMWTETYKFGIEILTEAYERTVNSATKFSFQYMGKILTSWFENGYSTLNEIKKGNKKPAKQKKNSTSSIDSEELVKFWLDRVGKEG